MKYPEQYPDGFLAAATGDFETDREVLRKGLDFYFAAVARAVRGTIASDAPMLCYILRRYLNAFESQSPGTREIATILDLMFPGTIETQKVLRKKTGE